MLLEKKDKDASLIVMSDHGFGHLKGEFSVNVWLQSRGLLAFYPKKMRMLRLKRNLEPVRALVRKLDVLNLRRLFMPKPAGNAGRMKSYEFLDCIDWSNTKAYSISSTEQGIYVNLQGREPNGIVRPGTEYEALRDLLIEELRKLIDPLSNEPLVNEVHKKEEIYQGKYVADAPDIIFFLKGGEYVASVIPKDSLFDYANLQMGTGTHRPAGILMGVGGGIKEAAQIPQLNIYDLTPTILYLMGAPVPDDMDGEVAWNMLKEEYVNTHSLTYAAGASVSTASGESDAYTIEEEQALRDQLKNLGYME
jgi:predicted AlkP superfamily phosphohydrolase/phosphomutase